MSVGRNEPCPCGSGKKYKKCCLDGQRQAPAIPLAEAASRGLHQALAGKKFGSLEEVQAFTDNHFQQNNQAPLEDFLGLSSEEMFHLLNHPFDSPQLISFPATIEITPEAPILTLFNLIVEAVGDQGLKATAKGNLPRKFCRDAALTHWGEEKYQEWTMFGGINKEEDFTDLNTTRLIAKLAGLVLLRKQKFVLTSKCRNLLATSGPGGIYSLLFRTYTQRFNWACRDGYPDFHIIQQAFAFSLFMLNRYGDREHTHRFYEGCFLRAFPRVVDEVDRKDYLPPKEQARACYTLRTLERFAGFLGLASIKKIDPVDPLDNSFLVKKLPLLNQIIQFHLPERAWPSADEFVLDQMKSFESILNAHRHEDDVKRIVSSTNEAYQFKITLREIEPPIWRQILIAGDATFWDLHVAIQNAMGWTDSHLHEFEILYPDRGMIEHLGIPLDDNDGSDDDILPGWEAKLAQFFTPDNSEALYRYDFGDCWEHIVRLEKTLPRDPEAQYPACLDGSRKCPPEDCGGTHGYQDFLSIITDPDHPEHDETLVWAGGRFDPEEFDPRDVVFEDPVERLEEVLEDD